VRRVFCKKEQLVGAGKVIPLDALGPSSKLKLMTPKKKKITLEGLARMIQRGFEDTATRGDLEGVRSEIRDLTTRLDRFETYVEGRFDTLEGEVVRIREEVKLLRKDLGNNEVNLHDLRSRVERLEKKLGLAK
jgi:predicted nuclease with TOPRIM domain